MADFCRSCSIAVLAQDSRDFAGLTILEDWARGSANHVLCEGCGPTQVSPDGECIGWGCLANHPRLEGT